MTDRIALTSVRGPRCLPKETIKADGSTNTFDLSAELFRQANGQTVDVSVGGESVGHWQTRPGNPPQLVLDFVPAREAKIVVTYTC